jgi:ADP-ribosylation factor-like protein 13B
MRCCFCAPLLPARAATVAVLGLDNAGKTTVVSCLRGEPDAGSTPSVGFSSEVVQHAGFRLHLYDVGGGKSIRRIWKAYYADLHGLVYVVDAADPARFEEARAVLAQALADPHLAGKPLLVLANKQDLPGSAPAHGLALALGLTELKGGVQYNILGCTALCSAWGSQAPEPGLSAGLSWLLGCVEAQYPQLQARVEQESEQVGGCALQQQPALEGAGPPRACAGAATTQAARG